MKCLLLVDPPALHAHYTDAGNDDDDDGVHLNIEIRLSLAVLA